MHLHTTPRGGVRMLQSIKNLFSRAAVNVLGSRVQKILPELRVLKQDIASAMSMRDPLSGLVAFFNAVSSWHDDRKLDLANYGDESPLAKKLSRLSSLISQSGRHEFGMNRTKPGQVVTDDDVWLGNIDGLFTKTISFWRTRKGEPKGLGIRPAYEVVCDQARWFLQNGTLIIDAIDDLERSVANCN
ncbi:hypothetical protein COW81_00505 [Candidatus Campbellbacteria bacterium CG22_combo_CG10-13_8_21_14_all_36_13]|uniref:Uncharacterized protein n=1 Tax=Candidatus Campbellbacteria bacterium CG22_combo_CG10-13_8_21_14_all_36_13 TaxID=1974529 RepID=A0A2H0DZ07_9BACT|nr:MAG: hypothetical protein COW81_00505 [Candidatus Campbellbacteria bacterium CG22_combo_CG10-13_8_21_14_all_36_13]